MDMGMTKTNRKMNLTLATVSAAVAVLAGCEVGPKYVQPDLHVPEAFATTGPASRPSTSVDARWWSSFGDPTLDALVTQAANSNLDLKRAAARLREARARRAFVSGGAYPQINGTAGYTHERISENAEPFSAFSGSGFPLEYDLYQLGFDANWEIDIFGGTRRNIRAADLDVAASVEEQRSILLSVIAEVARNYVELRGYQRELEVAERNLAVQRETVEVTRDRQRNGVTTQLEVAQAAGQASGTEAQLPALENLEWQAIHRIAVLLGKEPNALASELTRRAPIPVATGPIAIGIPSELVRRRPDLRRAERQLAASSERIGAAVAEQFPRFALNGNVGLQSSDIADLTDFGSRNFSFGPSLSIPIFRAGTLRAAVKVRTAQQEEALAGYEQLVLEAFREVEDALVAVQTEQRRVLSLRNSVASYQEAASVARDQYRQGVTDFLNVLAAERNLFEREDELARSELASTTSAIALYKALGGGWEAAEFAPKDPADKASVQAHNQTKHE